MAAALRDAPRGAAGATWIGSNRRSMPLTASKTAAWTMAATRVVTSGDVPVVRAVLDMIWFQSVMTSARAPPQPTRMADTAATIWALLIGLPRFPRFGH